MRADTTLRLARAREVRVGGLVRDAAALLRVRGGGRGRGRGRGRVRVRFG